MKKLLLCIVFISYALLVSGQVNFSGKVQSVESDKKEVLSFAPVVLTSVKDSLLTQSTLTDINGDFVIKSLAVGKYRISISYIGHRSIEEEVWVVFPTTGNIFTKNYVLEEDPHSLGDVVVTASTRTQDIDKTTFLITKDDLKHAVHGVDLLGKIPQLRFDESTQTVSSIFGGGVKILINGANASEQELKSLNASQIKSIEFYDFPPARYAGYAYVVNVIPKNIESGLYGSFNLMHAFTTGFFNDGLSLMYNWKSNQIGINAFSSYRDYTKVRTSSHYSFDLGGVKYNRDEEERRKFGYDDTYINLRFTRNVQDKYMVQVNFYPNFQHRHIDGKLDIEQLIDGNNYDRDGNFRERTSQFSPVLDIYTSITLPKRQELTINVTGTYHSADLQRSRTENLKSDGSVVLQDIMEQDNSKKSIIGQVHYSKRFGSSTLSVGDKFSYGKLNSSIDNRFATTDYFSDVTTNYLYTEFSGKKNKFMYRLTLGAHYYNNANNERSYDSWSFQPNLMLGYNITPKFSIRGIYWRMTSDPSLGQLSSNKTFISEGIIREGNPLLKNSSTDAGVLIFNVNHKWITADMRVGYQSLKRPINAYFVQDEGGNVMSQRYENAKSLKAPYFQYSLFIDPFKDELFTLNISGYAMYTKINSIVGNHTRWSTPLSYEATFNYKGLQLSYQGNIVTRGLSGPYLSDHEKVSTLRASYAHKNWTFSAMCLWFLVDAKYTSETVSGSLVNYSGTNNIRDNRSMFTLGLGFRFNTGKKYNEKNRYIKNTDRDAGLF